MNGLGKILFTLGLAVLMLFKVSAIHIYEHIDEHENHEECHLCDLAMENQVAELHFSPQIVIPENTSTRILSTIPNERPKTFVELSHKFGRFSRPPPTTS